MAYGLQLTGCGIFLVEQFSGISAVLKPNSQKQQSPRISVEDSFCMVAPGIEPFYMSMIFICFIYLNRFIPLNILIPALVEFGQLA